MHKKRVTAFLLCAGIISTAALTACSGNTTENTIQLLDTTLTGTVESIEGNTITLEVSGGMDGMPGGKEGGQSTSDSSGQNGSPADNEEADTKTDGKDQSENTGSGTDREGQSETPPEKPSDDQGQQNSEENTDAQSETPPEKPSDGDGAQGGDQAEQSSDGDGAQDGGGQPGMPSGGDSEQGQQGASVSGTAELVIGDESVIETSDEEAAGLNDIEEGDILTVTIDEEGTITSVVIGDTSSQGQDQQTASVSDYDALEKLTEDTEISGETYASTGTDENAIHIYNGADVTLDDISASRDSDDSTGGDNSSFYGVGSAVLVSDGTATIKNSDISTDAAGGAGVFAYNNGTAYVTDTTIKTVRDTSGGIHVAGGGTLYAWDLNVETNGESSAAIRSDRGGGTMVVDGGSYVSNGTGSPAVYCTADITANNAKLTANGSEGICIEGKNTLRLYDCDLTSDMPDDSRNDCTWSVILYQSMSGDSEVGNSDLEMVGGSIQSKNGGIFYTTNTECNILLSGVEIESADDSEFFLCCTGNANERGWGQTGSNGSQCTFTADDQTMEGDIIYDSISTLDFYMQNGSVLTGAVVDDETYAGNGGDGYCNMTISKDSKWIVTGDSTITSLSNEGTIVDADGKTVSIVGTDGTTYVEGDSAYTITTGSYSETADLSGAAEVTSFSDYEVERPA